MSSRSAMALTKQIHGPVVPLAIPFQEGLSIDHEGLERHVEWSMESGMRVVCLTFTYSVMDSLTSQEIVDVSKTVSKAASGKGIFISCTAGGPLVDCIKTVKGITDAGADAVMVHLPLFALQNQNCGGLYVRYLQAVAAETDIPIINCLLPEPWNSTKPMLSAQHFEELAQEEKFIGLKDDMYSLNYRLELARKFTDRLSIIGGGNLRNYVFLHRYTGQAEMCGMFNPKRCLRMFSLLDDNDVTGVLEILDESPKAPCVSADLHWIVIRQVRLYAAGFAKTYQLRPPFTSATAAQADEIIANMKEYPELYERIER